MRIHPRYAERMNIEAKLIDMWATYTAEKREGQLAEMRDLLADFRSDPNKDQAKVERFAEIIDMLEDWHQELT